jgi:hypothetical protein
MGRSTKEKVRLFSKLFVGLTNAYGTYDPSTGNHRQVKKTVTWQTFYQHLKGNQPYGFYPLVGNRTRIAVADFDHHNPEPALHFVSRAEHYDIPAYLERSKSKGYHAWIFFNKEGVKAWKARAVIKLILEDIEMPETEIFPKQDSIDPKQAFGNFINAPLFGQLVPEGKTVFISADKKLEPYPNQWTVLESIQKTPETLLDEIIEENELEQKKAESYKENSHRRETSFSKFGLPPCAQKMLEHGVSFNQRVACFRLAVNLQRIGLPLDLAISLLNEWRKKNRPQEKKRIITEEEILEQTSSAYNKDYSGLGCNEEIVKAFCTPECPVRK